MLNPFREKTNFLEFVEKLITQGYWPARAAKYLQNGTYSRAVEICRENLDEAPDLISDRVLYATALYKAGQNETATEQFYRVLAKDPDNIVALKYLADIKFNAGDEYAALANYQRILEIDPDCEGLRCDLNWPDREKTHTITITRGSEEKVIEKPVASREIPFYTETIGDLYLAQGHSRLALEVYRHLCAEHANPRLAEKLAQAEEKIKHKDN